MPPATNTSKKEYRPTSPIVKTAQAILIPLFIAILLYLMVAPFLPGLWFEPGPDLLPEEGSLVTLGSYGTPQDEITGAKGPRLVIPKIKVDAPILEGASENTLNHGVWHRPETGSPLEGGNMVLTAHRFQYLSGPLTFYFLDKLSKGDHILVYWKNKTYTYQIKRVFTVPISQISVEDQTDSSILTLYTCTPLWSATKRLVIQAEPVTPTASN